MGEAQPLSVTQESGPSCSLPATSSNRTLQSSGLPRPLPADAAPGPLPIPASACLQAALDYLDASRPTQMTVLGHGLWCGGTQRASGAASRTPAPTAPRRCRVGGWVLLGLAAARHEHAAVLQGQASDGCCCQLCVSKCLECLPFPCLIGVAEGRINPETKQLECAYVGSWRQPCSILHAVPCTQHPAVPVGSCLCPLLCTA